MHRMLFVYFLFAPLFFYVTACAPQQAQPTPPAVDLIPFATSTHGPLRPSGPAGLITAETPLPSPTPFTYTVQSGDTISSIALKFGLSMDDLLAANP